MVKSESFTCNLCKKTYSSASSLCNHRSKIHKITRLPKNGNLVTNRLPKNGNQKSELIEISNDLTLCKYCNKKLASRHSRWRHEQICKNKELMEIKNKLDIQTLNNNINNGTINNTINNNIVINNYNEDNLKYISDEFIKRMFVYMGKDNQSHLPIPKVIENIKFNPSHKENNNVKITNTRSRTGLKYHNNKWMTVKKEELLNELFNLGVKILNEWAKDRTEILTQSMIENYEKYILFSKHFKKEDIKEELNLKAYIYTKNHMEDLDK